MAAILGAGCQKAPKPLPPRNLVLITVDTLRADHVGAYNPAFADSTPHMDRLAAKGVVFVNAGSPVPLTTAAHASILTGLFPARHGVRLNGAHALAEGIPTLATELQAQGWETGAFVAAYVLSRRFGLARGFATYDDRIPIPAYAGLRLEAERPGSQTMDSALAWLEKHAGTRFFLWVHLYEPHAPYEPPSPFRERFAHSPYDGEVAAADAQVGRLLEELARLGLESSTVVALAGDHGEALGEHGESTHGLLLYEATLHVPLVVAAPDLPPGLRVTAPVSLVDLAPTLLHLAGSSRPLVAQGRDLAPFLLARQQPPETTLFAETLYPESFGWAGLLAARKGRFKFVAAPKPELFDLSADPGETRNLAGQDLAQEPGLKAAIEGYLEGAAEGKAVPLDAEARRQLESLGYIAPSSPTPQTAADPKDRVRVFALFEKAHTLRLAGDPVGAREVLAEALKEDPQNPVLLAEQAEVLRATGDAKKAVAVLRHVLEINPADREARYNLAMTLREAGEDEEALQTLLAAIRLDPGRPELHEAAGVLLAARGAFAQAKAEFARACQLEPQNPRAWNNLGNACRELGELAAAEDAYRRAIACDPTYAEPHNGLGVLAVQQGRYAEAVASFQRALELAPENLEALLNLGIAWDEAGNRDKAGQAYREFLQRAAGKPPFAPQVAAARQLLVRLERGVAPAGKGGGGGLR